MTEIPCGCTSTQPCIVAQRLGEAWQKASARYERLPTGGNEYALRKAFEAVGQHNDPSFKMLIPVGRLGG